MSAVAISVDGVAKRYAIFHRTRRPDTLRDALAEKIRKTPSRLVSLLGRDRKPSEKSEIFWALRNISFDVRQGDRIGIIGRNGAGKSTLLKILSRIVEPTLGRVSIRGRIASLLEVGTGFHPELTGRENIYLNGAMLGMSRLDIKGKFDQIVDFAEVEKFLDTPVKHYSSGMYVRLAFAVAAHLDPDILVVDEVLAVGDASFQQKCLGKMNDISTVGGRTLVFVSHNMAAVHELCNRGILLDKGELSLDGDVKRVIARYSSIGAGSECRFKSEGTRFTEVSVTAGERSPVGAIESTADDVYLRVGVMIEVGAAVNIGFTVFDQMNMPLVSSSALDSLVRVHEGMNTFRIKLPTRMLKTGVYRVEGSIWNTYAVLDQHDHLTAFEIQRNSHNERTGIGYRGALVVPDAWEQVS